jgi:hypothetical protein
LQPIVETSSPRGASLPQLEAIGVIEIETADVVDRPLARI